MRVKTSAMTGNPVLDLTSRAVSNNWMWPRCTPSNAPMAATTGCSLISTSGVSTILKCYHSSCIILLPGTGLSCNQRSLGSSTFSYLTLHELPWMLPAPGTADRTQATSLRPELASRYMAKHTLGCPVLRQLATATSTFPGSVKSQGLSGLP